MRLNGAVERVVDSPIGAAYALPGARPAGAPAVLDLAQAAPAHPPPAAVAEHVARVAGTSGGAAYTDVPGLRELRAAVAAEIDSADAGSVDPRDVVLVTPGNPSGATVPPGAIAEFAALARRHGATLLLDETYRCFRDTDDPPHRLLTEPRLGRHGWSACTRSPRSSPSPATASVLSSRAGGAPGRSRESWTAWPCALRGSARRPPGRA